MANNNVPPTPSTLLPYFVPRIVMIATYSQSTQTPITSTSNNYHVTLLKLYTRLSQTCKRNSILLMRLPSHTLFA